MKRITAILLVLCLALGWAAAAEQEPRKAYVLICADAAEGVLKTSGGAVVQQLHFDAKGQTAAGPLPPGDYVVEAGCRTAAFTLRTNAAVTQVTGDGWSDGESVRLGPVTQGQLTVCYDGLWRWVLEGEGADRAVPELSVTQQGKSCTFTLPLGAYTLCGTQGRIPVLLTPESPEQMLTLP